jgi:hypothetical protein
MAHASLESKGYKIRRAAPSFLPRIGNSKHRNLQSELRPALQRRVPKLAPKTGGLFNVAGVQKQS